MDLEEFYLSETIGQLQMRINKTVKEFPEIFIFRLLYIDRDIRMKQKRKNISRTWFLSFSERKSFHEKVKFHLFIYFYVIAI